MTLDRMDFAKADIEAMKLKIKANDEVIAQEMDRNKIYSNRIKELRKYGRANPR